MSFIEVVRLDARGVSVIEALDDAIEAEARGTSGSQQDTKAREQKVQLSRLRP